jgi:hypothetical protein
MKTHELKTWPKPFLRVWTGKKVHELRKNDRNFKIGDRLILHEYLPHRDPEKGLYTGRSITCIITDITEGVEEWGLRNGYVIMSIRQVLKTGSFERKN